MENQIDITKLCLTELQSLAYTLIEAVEVAQANLKLTNEEIAKRRKQTEEGTLEIDKLVEGVEENK